MALLVPIGEIFGSPFAINPAKRTPNALIFFFSVPIACFVAGYWVLTRLARKLPSHAPLHGVLVGIVATGFYFGLAASQPKGLGAVVAAYGVPLFTLTQALRIAGCLAGAALQKRRNHDRTGL